MRATWFNWREPSCTNLNPARWARSANCCQRGAPQFLFGLALLFIVGPMGIYVYDVHDIGNPQRLAAISNIG